MPIWRRSQALPGLEFRAGDVLEQRYQVLAVKRGHVELVYLTRDLQSQEMVALKTLPPHFSWTPAMVESIEREAESWTRLGRHPHLVYLQQVLLIAGRPHLLMEHVDGQTLRQPAARLGRTEILDALIQLCWAMQYAYHRCALVHGDLRPEHMFITPMGAIKLSGPSLLPALLRAVGLPRAGAEHGQARKLLQRSLAIMAPEQRLPGGIVGPWSDIYAAGVMLFELLTGRHIAGASSDPSHELSTSTVRALAPELPPAYAYIVGRCLERDLARRYSSFSALERDLQLLRQQQLGSRLAPAPQVEALGQAAYADYSGRARYAAGEHAAALECFRRAVQAEPRRASFWLHLGMAQSALLRYADALRSFERAAALQPTLNEQIELWRLRGETYERLYNLPQALRAYQHILALDRRQRAGWLGLARLLLQQARLREAHEAYCEALKLDPHDPVLWLGRAQVEQLLGRPKQAIQSYDAALKRSPRDASAWCGKARALAALRRHREALACYRTACSLDPHLAEAQTGLLECQRLLGLV